jgi:hypothetical protein
MTQVRQGIVSSTEVGHQHAVRFYDDRAGLLDEIAEFIDSALRTGGTGIVIATAELIATLMPRWSGLAGKAVNDQWYPGRLPASWSKAGRIRSASRRRLAR